MGSAEEKGQERADAAELRPGDVFQTEKETEPHGEPPHGDSWLVTEDGVEKQHNED